MQCSARRSLDHHLGFSHFSFFALTSAFGLHSHLVCSVKLSWKLCCDTRCLTRSTSIVTFRVSVGTHSSASSLQHPAQRMRTTQDGMYVCSISSGYSWMMSTSSSRVLHALFLYTSMKGITSFLLFPPSLGMWAAFTADRWRRAARNNCIK